MASQAKQQKKGWGSLLSGAVAGLESKLDTILAEDNEASARSRAAEQALKEAKRARGNSGNLSAMPARAPSNASRDASRSRVNERLAERLAKATASKPPSEQPSRVASPALGAVVSTRASTESRPSVDVTRPGVEETTVMTGEPAATIQTASVEETPTSEIEPAPTLLNSGLPINPSRHSEDTASSRPSLDINVQPASPPKSPSLANGHTHPPKSADEYEKEMEQMRRDYSQAEEQRLEELHAHMERIDALQAKLTYLANSTVAAAKEANANTPTGTAEQKLAEKDERIALLMQEGEKLSKTELRHISTIKKLRAKTSEEERATAELRKRLSRAEHAEKDLKAKLQRAEIAERQANEKARQISAIEKQIEELNEDRESASTLIRQLTTQLSAAKKQAADAERRVDTEGRQADLDKIASLENELEDAQIEKKLAEDRATAEITKVAAELEQQKEKFGLKEMELKNEVANLEARVEALRSRAEEVSSDVAGDGHAKLLRQVETLQSQYSLAAQNWQTIEASLNARVAALEKERDEATKREGEVRKKARDVGLRGRKVEEELESASEQSRNLTQELKTQRELVKDLNARLEHSETALADAKGEAERQKRLWDIELSQRLEEEKSRWHSQSSHHPPTGNESPTSYQRKLSTIDFTSSHPRKPANRLTSHDLATLHAERPTSRRGSTMHSKARATPDRDSSPVISRQESTLSLDTHNIPPTPDLENADAFERSSSPNRTMNDMVSHSTLGTGPSVQLVERMSAAVRRLESEKAASRDEMVRLVSQRDEARDEVVRLMREVEEARGLGERVGALEGELGEVRKRYEASLEMLGEREEEVGELRQDVADLKRIYRELVERSVR